MTLDDGMPLIGPREARVLYQDLLARPPFADERAHWLGKPMGELVEHLLKGLDLWSNWYEEQLYYFLLVDNFRPVSERVQAIPEALAEGRLDVREALHRIALSPSFERRNPGADTFVTVVMEQLLGLTVQDNRRQLEIGKTLYDGGSGQFLGRSGQSQADVVRIAIEDKRAMAHLVEREYRRLLRHRPARRSIEEWARGLYREPSSFVDLLHAWLSSEDYGDRLGKHHGVSNRLFVRSLFVDLAGRLPQVDEAERMRNALDGLADPAPLRSILARLLIDSGQALVPERSQIGDEGQWVIDLFERLLGRSPSSEERAVFVRALDDPDCRPETVLYAIVSHPEYTTS